MGLMPDSMDTKQKVMLGVAVLVLAAGGYLIYTNLFAGGSSSAAPVTATSSGTTTGAAPAATQGSQPSGPAQPPNRRSVTK